LTLVNAQVSGEAGLKRLTIIFVINKGCAVMDRNARALNVSFALSINICSGMAISSNISLVKIIIASSQRDLYDCQTFDIRATFVQIFPCGILSLAVTE
jgi:hypothetical protein